MSTLETNSIAKYSGNNVAIDDSLNLKSYTTTQRDALTSAAGDMIYNSTTSKVQVYTGSAWEDLGGVSGVLVEYLLIAGGGAGGGASGSGGHGGGGGAGGYISKYASENSGGGDTTTQKIILPFSTNIFVSIGAGGSGASGRSAGGNGTDTYLGSILAIGGGGEIVTGKQIYLY